MTIKTKFAATFFFLVILPVLVGTAIMFYFVKDIVRDVRFLQLENIANLEKERLEAFFLERQGDVSVFQSYSVVKDNLPAIYSRSDNPNDSKYKAAENILRARMSALKDAYGYYDIMLTDPSGAIVLSAGGIKNRVGRSLSDIDVQAFEAGKSGIYLGRLFNSVAAEGEEDFHMVMAAPLLGLRDEFIGEVVFEINLEQVFEYLRAATGLGATGDTFIGVPNGDEVLFISSFHTRSNRNFKAKDIFDGKRAIPMQQALRGVGGSGEYTDYLGHDIFAAWRAVPSLGWGLVAKIDSSEAVAPVEAVIRAAMVAELVILFMFLSAAALLTKSIIRPISELKKGMEIIGSGNFEHRVGTDAGDEIGQLSRELDTMAANLRKVTASRDELDMEVAERKRAEREVKKLNEELEIRVVERTAELTAANNELEAFTYSVSHDLRSPLRHVQGFVDMLINHSADSLDEKGRRYLNTISSSAIRMGNLVDDLLSFSRMGRTEMNKSRVDLRKLADTVISELKVDAEGREVTWKVSDMPEAYGDPSMLRLAISNLLSNALKFTSTSEHAVIEMGSMPGDGNETVYFVKDNGVGFDMQYVDKLFGVFQRLHKPEEFEGTGIGLANVRRIISRHGGRTWAEGALGEGAAIYFTLPIRGQEGERHERT